MADYTGRLSRISDVSLTTRVGHYFTKEVTSLARPVHIHCLLNVFLLHEERKHFYSDIDICLKYCTNHAGVLLHISTKMEGTSRSRYQSTYAGDVQLFAQGIGQCKPAGRGPLSYRINNHNMSSRWSQRQQ